LRDPLAAFVGCNRDEIALLRNATEANSYIANGIDLKPGDEVLMTDQEHPGGEHPWNLRAKRYGIVVKKVTLPKPVENPAQALNLFSDAITPRTRVMFFSHISTFSGVVLPAKELCALARRKGIISAVDGAHVPGMMRLNLHELGCDLYSSSPHKWLQAPKGSGFLYVRDEMIDRVWNTIATEGWDDVKLRAERFQRIGSSNVPALWGLRASIQLANDIGMDRIEHRQLATTRPWRRSHVVEVPLHRQRDHRAVPTDHPRRQQRRLAGLGRADQRNRTPRPLPARRPTRRRMPLTVLGRQQRTPRRHRPQRPEG